MVKKWRLIAAGAAVGMLQTAVVSAQALPFSNADWSNWDAPAKGEDLKRVRNDPLVDTVDIEQSGQSPTGIYWLNARYGTEEQQ